MMLPREPSDELAGCAYLAAVPGFTADMVGTTLPPDVNPDKTPAEWLKTGYVTVAVAGGNPDPLLPVRRPVLDVQCWAARPGSNRPPWNQAMDIASAIIKATWDRGTLGRDVVPSVNGVAYPAVSVQGARVVTSPRRLYSDAADYAAVSLDLWLSWVTVAPADIIP